MCSSGSVVESRNDQGSGLWRGEAIGRIFEQIASEFPNKIAICEGNSQITYQQLARISNSLVCRLTDRGAGPGTLIGIMLPRSIGMVAAMLACAKMGAAYVPLDVSYPLQRLRSMAREAGVALVITDNAAQEVPAAIGASPVYLGELPETFGTDSHPEFDVSPEHSAYVMFTSGSTGSPKGVVIPQRAIINLVRVARFIDFGPQEVFAQVSNASFDAITFEVWGALLNGATLAILPPDTLLSATAFADAIERHEISVMFLTSALFNVMAERIPCALAGVRHLMVGGDAVDPRWARHVLSHGRAFPIINGYGPTECTTFSLTHPIHQVLPSETIVPVGRPIANARIYVLDEQLRPVADGMSGQLFIGGAGLAKGYLNDPVLTSQRFIEDPFLPGERIYATGDMARLRADGTVECLGRTDSQVKIRGFRIELGEIDAAIRSFAGVADCAVIARDDKMGGKIITAYVVYRRGSVPESTELRSHLSRTLPGFMMPGLIVRLDALPLTPNGKLDHAALPCVESDQDAATRLTLSGPQRIIHDIWSRATGAGRIALDDNFFELGGTSLHLPGVEGELRKHFSGGFTTLDLFRYPTLRSLSEHLSSVSSAETAPEANPALRASSQNLAFARMRAAKESRR